MIIAKNSRGSYILKGNWVHSKADKSKQYKDCIMGDINYFVNVVVKNDKNMIITDEGKQMFSLYNNCKKAIKCTYCKDDKCLLSNKVVA